jgi:hypothetical protein
VCFDKLRERPSLTGNPNSRINGSLYLSRK